MSENNLCWCGHAKDAHFVDYEGCCDEHFDYEYPVCYDCEQSDELDVNPDHFFEVDNLRFLERIDEHKPKS